MTQKIKRPESTPVLLYGYIDMQKCFYQPKQFDQS